MNLSTRDAKRIIRLLGNLQDHLEAIIDGEMLPGESEAHEPARRPMVARTRRRWREAEDLIMLLDDGVPPAKEKKK